MYNTMYNVYDNASFEYYYPLNFDNRYKDYMLSKYAPKGEWSHGDTITLTFHLEDYDVTQELYEGKTVIINFYNYRYELMPITYKLPAEENINIEVNNEQSLLYFPEGTYHCSLTLQDYSSDAEENEFVNTSTVILNKEDCLFVVR